MENYPMMHKLPKSSFDMNAKVSCAIKGKNVVRLAALLIKKHLHSSPKSG